MSSLLDINGRIMSFVEGDVESRVENKFVVFASAQKFLQNHFFETFPINIFDLFRKSLSHFRENMCMYILFSRTIQILRKRNIVQFRKQLRNFALSRKLTNLFSFN
jgi:hypothetical protein